MAIDGENPQNIWVTFGGKQNTRKVGKSTNGGDTWINYTGTGLPSYSVNCIINQMGTDGDVYIGTDAGVYYRNNTQDSWTPYSFNLPLATHVGWIKINYAKAKLRIAGQTGIWECDLTSPSTPVAHPTTPVFENEANTDIQIADMSVALSDATYLWDFPGGTPSSSTDERPLVQFSQGGDKNISLTVTDANGSSKKTYNNFIRVRNVGEISKTGWKVIGFDSQETSAEKTEATKAIDGNENTIWGTDWASENPGYPHYISIDMGSSTAIESFNYRGQLSNGNGDVKGYEWYLSEDKDNWGLPVATGEFSSTRGKKVVSLVKPLTGRYFKFVATSQQSGTNWCKASEIGVTGSSSVISAFSASSTLAKKGSEITLNDFSAGNPTSWKWSFPGGTPSSSTEQNPVVTYSGDGLYPVTLTVSNSNGTDILEKESYINITDFVPQSGWSVVYVDSEEMDKEETPGSNAIDGDPSSYWGTDWSDLNPSHPHEIIIDMGDEYPVSGFNYLPRQNNANGRIGSYSFYTSLDNTSWKLQKKNGTFPNTSSEQSVDFSKSTTARYFKLVAFSEVNNNPWTCVAELKMKLDYAILSSVEYIQSSKNINIYSYHNQVVVDNNETSQGLISVFDITGRKLFTTKLNIGSNKILGVQAGIYIVKVMVDNKIISRKVIVRN
jgi:PKD repeat protein